MYDEEGKKMKNNLMYVILGGLWTVNFLINFMLGHMLIFGMFSLIMIIINFYYLYSGHNFIDEILNDWKKHTKINHKLIYHLVEENRKLKAKLKKKGKKKK